jgi:hypothetical protein
VLLACSVTVTEIQAETYSGPIALNARWLRIPAAVKYSGLSRADVYNHIQSGDIVSICLKRHRHATRGIRLIDRESIDRFMLAQQAKTAQEQEGSDK